MDTRSRRKLLAAQAKVLRTNLRAYRTTATAAAQILAGEMPLDLELCCKRAAFQLRKGKDIEIPNLKVPNSNVETQGIKIEAASVANRIITKAEAMRRVERTLLKAWQKRWDEGDTGRTVYEYFPNVSKRLNNKNFKPEPSTVAIMTGHGPFNAYLYERCGKGDPTCECGAWQTAKHLVFERDLMTGMRRSLRRKVREKGHQWPCSPRTLVEDKEIYQKFEVYAKDLIENLEQN